MTNHESIQSSVRRLIAGIVNSPLEQITGESSPSNPETWDSLAHLDVIVGLEQEFRVRFTTREIEGMTDVKAIVDLIGRKTGAQYTENGASGT